jgi:hypothetical protein
MKHVGQALLDVALVVAGLLVIAFFAQWSYVAVVYLVLPIERAVQVVEVRNQSGIDVAEVRIPICGHELTVSGLRPGGSAAMRFPLECSDQKYGMWVRLASGKELAQPAIYISGLSHHDILTILGPDSSRFHIQDVSGADLAAARR